MRFIFVVVHITSLFIFFAVWHSIIWQYHNVTTFIPLFGYAIMNNLLWTFLYVFFGGGVCVCIKLLGRRLCLSPFCRYCWTSCIPDFTLILVICDNSHCSSFLLILDIIRVFDFCQSGRNVSENCIVVLICISLITSDIEHLFIYMSISFFVGVCPVCLFGILCFLLLIYNNTYIFWMESHSVYERQIYFPGLWFSFSLCIANAVCDLFNNNFFPNPRSWRHSPLC